MKVGTDGVLLGAWADVSNAQRILDIGTGNGLIAIMLGQRNAEAQIDAVEIEAEACTEARENMQNAPWAERLRVLHVSVQDYVGQAPEPYDLIVSNPPFFSGGTFSDQQDRASVRHTVKLPHGDLLAAVRALLQEQGRFCVILPVIEGLRFQEMATRYNLYCNKIMEVRPKDDKPAERLLMQFEKTQKPLVEEMLILQKEGKNNWTEDYIALTGDFYLYM